ncbi:hypothetical protein MNB_SV-3-157 [hydrothermal vent metagenome]|uniref:Uncharacterized protein n=1 Tax=hydrothermal vent metagenome TaxID=652676 RepID=A0A1W1BRC5_9ZZZZ
MNIREEKLFHKLQIYFEMGQSIAIVNPMDLRKKEIVNFFEKEVIEEWDTVYVDFNEVEKPCDLARIIAEQCVEIISKYKDVKINIAEIDYEDDYHCLDRTLNLSEKIAKQINKHVVFIAKNYTNVLSLDEGKRMQEHMRAIFQHQYNVKTIFTGESKEALNKIFMNSSAPFFRFAEIIDTNNEGIR